MSSGSPPLHLGIIMDGNGRWASQKNLPRSAGHREGLKAAKAVVKAAHDLGIRYVTLYTFSTENWKRTEEEVSFLMKLLKNNLRKEYQFYLDNDIRVVHSGDISSLPDDIKQVIRDVEKDTEDFSGTTVNLAINYGGRDEILRAVKTAADTLGGVDLLDEETVRAHLDQADIPDLDLVVRSGGEQRLSNFMLWRSSYSEIYFTHTLWPDFTAGELQEIIHWFQGRNRRYGGL